MGCQLYDGVLSVLSALKAKYKLALVSNCRVGLAEVIDAVGLTPFFTSLVLSYQVGVGKPDPASTAPRS
jgi:FMN phosphatase YigB (HAD superfamily)